MRIKDINKQEAIIKATVKLVHEIGFVSSSVSKISKIAGVSPATLYIYYENKEDLLVSTYVEIKKKMSEELLKDLDETKPFRDLLKDFWFNGFKFISQNQEIFQYAEQFANSPYSELVDQKKIEKFFEPIVAILQKGIKQKIIKDVSIDILAVFIFHPITLLAKSKSCHKFNNKKNIETAFDLAWDAIKL